MSLSTTEAELVAGALALKTAGLPAIIIMKILSLAANVGRNSQTLLHFHVDNQAMASVIRTGRNPTMRHLSRTHGIAISWLHEQYNEDDVRLAYITTTLMAADIYTKAFQDATKWTNLCEQINLIDVTQLSLPHIHALHSLVLSDSAPVTGKKIQPQQTLMPEELWDWEPGLGWHERWDWDSINGWQKRNIRYCVVREPKLYRTCSGDGGHNDIKLGCRTTWLKNSTGWFCEEKQQLWETLPNPREPITQWVERGVFILKQILYQRTKVKRVLLPNHRMTRCRK